MRPRTSSSENQIEEQFGETTTQPSKNKVLASSQKEMPKYDTPLETGGEKEGGAKTRRELW